MNETNRNTTLVRWAARIWSLLSIAFLLLILFGEGLGNLAAITATEWLLLLFFPFGVLLGLILAWRWEMLGGGITMASLFLFYTAEFAISGSLADGPWFLLVAFPGLLFMIAARRGRHHPRQRLA